MIVIFFFLIFLIPKELLSQIKHKQQGFMPHHCLLDTSIYPFPNKSLSPTKIFNFSNSKIIASYYHVDDNKYGDSFIIELLLSECNTGKQIDFWDAVSPCELKFFNDTLYVKEVNLFALRVSDSLVLLPWKTNLFYYNNKKLDTAYRFNKKIHYNKSQIEMVLKEYTNALSFLPAKEKKYYASEKDMELANKLMIASISGNQQAEIYFKEFKETFYPSGHYLKWYYEMKDILEFSKSH